MALVLPAAIDRATYIAFSPSETDRTMLVACRFRRRSPIHPGHASLQDPAGMARPLPEWAHYPAGTAWALGEAGLSTPAMLAAFSSDIPAWLGPESSASIEMAFGVAWSKLGGWSRSPMQLALLGQKGGKPLV